MRRYFRSGFPWLICCVLSNCGVFYLGSLGSETWIEAADVAWGDLEPGSYLVCHRTQFARIGEEGVYINPYGNTPSGDLHRIEAGEVFRVQRLLLDNAGTFSAHILYMADKHGSQVRLAMAEPLFTERVLNRVGFTIRGAKATRPGSQGKRRID